MTNIVRRELKESETEKEDWEAIYRHHVPRVYNYFRYRFGEGFSAEDLTAITFEKAWRNRKKFKNEHGKLKNWLYTIARNVAADYFRSMRPEVPLDDLADGTAHGHVEEQVEQGANLERLGFLLAQLSSRDRELVGLKYGAGLSNREIAELVGLSESNVGTILHRTVSHLRENWEK